MSEQEIKTTVNQKSNYQYETFEVGNKAILLDDSKEKDVFAAIDELGLAGQKDLIKSQSNRVIPYVKMTKREERVWKEYCPKRIKLEEYTETQIPYEILTVLQLIKQKGWFDIKQANGTSKKTGWLEVWSETAEDIDPLVVGIIESDKKDHDGDFGYRKETGVYMIARWGISLRPFEQIAELARRNFIRRNETALKSKIDKATEKLNNVEQAADQWLNGATDDYSWNRNLADLI